MTICRPRHVVRTGLAARSRDGFTLIEVLIAMAVLTIALLAIAGMFPAGYRQVTDAGRMTLQVTVGRQILEDIGAVPFANLLNLNNFNTQTSAPPATDPEMTMATRWQANLSPAQGAAVIQVADCGLVANPCALPAANPNLRRVTVTVSLTALTQSPVQLTTFIANIGM
jgi:prepilin-type N-terminal cleavage/methylation domain-containing protein